MTSFEESITEGYVKKIPINKIRTKSLIKSSEQAIKTAKEIQLKIESAKSVLRELYEGLREYCEAIGYLKGYKFLSHESITYFLRDILAEEKISSKFERYRKIRNGINYYGNEISIETVKEALNDIPQIIIDLNKYLKEVILEKEFNEKTVKE